ncbi:MAG: hypothetical protein FJ218_01870 [Ignavibacteria bacterium]|nr:hypothetical protein [Ignavibacteria bacterium]
MIQRSHYLEIANKCGHFASWAIWANEGKTPKSNIGDLKIFDLDLNPNILVQINPNIIMVGLNISRKIENTFGNFHDSKPQSQDYKIRYAFKNTGLYGAYMTDIIKDFEQIISGTVHSFLKLNRDFEEHNVAIFEQELLDLNPTNPILIAFGSISYNILLRNFKTKYQIIKIPHYSMRIGKENYRSEVEKIIRQTEIVNAK